MCQRLEHYAGERGAAFDLECCRTLDVTDQLMPGYSHDQTNVGGEGGFYCQMIPLPLYFGGSGRKTHPSDVPLQSRGFLASRAQDVIRHTTNLVGWEQSPVPPVAEPSSSSVPTRARWPPCEHGLCTQQGWSTTGGPRAMPSRPQGRPSLRRNPTDCAGFHVLVTSIPIACMGRTVYLPT